MVEATTNTLVTPTAPAQAADKAVIYCHALESVNPLAPAGTAVALDGGVVEHGEASRSDHWRKQPVSAERRWSDQAPRDHGRHLTGDAAPVVLSVAGQSRPPVTIAAR
jgi:hypothetical protein